MDIPFYYPSYVQLDARQRGAYLRWLVDGRREATVDIVFVFIFFYGLERRVLVDIAKQPPLLAELPAIHREVTELLTRYGDEHSFASYARSFLNLIEAYALLPGATPIHMGPPPLVAEKPIIPVTLKAEIGRIVSEGRKITADRAVATTRYSPP